MKGLNSLTFFSAGIRGENLDYGPQENICFVKESNFHKKHIAIRPIASAFEKLQESFTKTSDDLIKLKMSLENF